MYTNTRKQLAWRLLYVVNDKFEQPRGNISKIAAEFNKHRITVSKLWSKLLK